jgi:hypothetical protein
VKKLPPPLPDPRPAAERAVAALQRQLAVVRHEHPGLPPKQQLQLAKARCGPEIVAMNTMQELAEAARRGRKPLLPGWRTKEKGASRSPPPVHLR